MMTLWEVAAELSRRLTDLARPDGRRPVSGTEKFQNDPHWRDLVLFYEYFHGDNGAGVGASHQTGWTGLVAKLLQQSGEADASECLVTASPPIDASVFSAKRRGQSKARGRSCSRPRTS